MKKTTENRSFRTKMFLAAILVSGNFLTVYGQFSSTLGFGFPVSEKGLSGMIATPGPNSGDFVLLGDNVNHPNALAGPNGDMQIIRLDNLGNPIPSSNLLIRPTTDNAAWIERASCGGARYLITGHDQDNILVSMTMLDGVSTWTRSIGSPSPSVETGVWVNMDANGLVDVVGNEYNFSIARLAVVVAQLDCNGNDIWKMSYALNGYELTATSATTFATVPGGINGSCYITGRAIQVGTGIQKVFILRINSTTGSPIFIATYDVAPGWNDVATCIQGSTAPGAQGGLWVSGFSENGNGVLNLLLMKTDLNGNPQWANNYDIPGGDEYATHFEFAANNKLVVTGMGEAGVDGQGNETGYCLLMRVNDTGNTIDWTRLFANKDYSSRGNRVEVTANDEYFITGQSLELLTPVQPAYNILAIKTNPQGLIPNTPCYHDVVTQIIPRSPVMTGASLSLGLVTDNLPTILTNVHYSDQATFCSPVPPQCDFSWTPSGCFQMQFTGTTQYTGTGNYKFVWDIGCDGTPEGTTFGLNSNTSTFNYNFPCGNNTYQVCLKVTDPGGTVCTIMHTVTVGSCECWSTSNPSLVCSTVTGNPTAYDFSITVASNYPGATNCSYTLPTPTGTSLLAGPFFSPPVGNATTITGTVVWPSNVPLPNNLGFTVNATCTCPSGLPFSCSIPVTIPTVCCKRIAVFDQVVCRDAATLDVPVQTINAAILHNITQVSWYVQPKPANGICPTAPWGGTPYQDGPASSLNQLHLYPNGLSGDVCVYAVVHLNDGPCQILTSNVACISLCQSTTCTIPGQDYCYTGTPIVPGLLTPLFSLPANPCFSSVEWFDPQGNSVQIGGSSYQPTAGLTMADPTNCYEDFFYTLQITDDCGQHTCQAHIRLYSESAFAGSLAIDPLETIPVCLGADLTVVFTAGCAGTPPLPPTWTWSVSLDGINYAPLGAGNQNTIWNTNQIWQETWFAVTSKNGVCPIDVVTIDIDVRPPQQINYFIAQPAPTCSPTGVYLEVEFTPLTPDPNCPATVEWYKDGLLLATTGPPAAAPASFSYVPPPGVSIAGNYYCIVRSDCCDERDTSQVVQIAPPCFAIIAGPCFICDDQQVMLQGLIIHPAPGTTCAYQWSTSNGHIVSVNAAGDIATVDAPGLYVFTATCTDINGVICIKTAYFDLVGCTSGQLRGECGLIITGVETPANELHPVHIFPNPTTGEISVEWTGQAPKDAQLLIVDLSGKVLQRISVPEAVNSLTAHVDDLAAGIYFVKIQSADQVYTVAKLVKE